MDGQLHLVPTEDSTTETTTGNPGGRGRGHTRLSATTIENGRKGVAMARASLEASRKRRLEAEAEAQAQAQAQAQAAKRHHGGHAA